MLKAGRVVLIQANKISRDFLLKKNNENKGSMASWDKVCRPKKTGGLGLRKMKVVNSAFLSKLT